MVNSQGFNPTTGEWNDTLTGDFIWTNTNIGEAFSDVGAALSHAAIVARELGIPAVVGCGDATARLKTGDQVLVDGGAGTVTVMRKA